MDAIRKKMKSIKDETEGLYAIINKFETETKESNDTLAKAEIELRDLGKKVHNMEVAFEDTIEKLNASSTEFEEKDKILMEVDSDISALTRRIMLMEEEAKKSESNLANTVRLKTKKTKKKLKSWTKTLKGVRTMVHN